jgi:hypothetical protein
MADQVIEIAGKGHLRKDISNGAGTAYAWAMVPVDDAGTIIGEPGGTPMDVNLATLIAGEDQTNNRLNTVRKAVAADAIQETLQAAQTGAANGTAISIAGYRGLTVLCTIVATITVNFELSNDGGTTYTAVAMLQSTTTASATRVTTATASGLFAMPPEWMGCATHFRARTSGPSGSPSATVVSCKVA